jgi:hypothetical protein
MLSEVRPAPRLMFFKAHVKGYTRMDGVYVKPHEDKRTAAADDAVPGGPTSVRLTPQEIYRQRQIEHQAAVAEHEQLSAAVHDAMFGKLPRPTVEQINRLIEIRKAALVVRQAAHAAMENAKLALPLTPEEVYQQRLKESEAATEAYLKINRDVQSALKQEPRDEAALLRLRDARLAAGKLANAANKLLDDAIKARAQRDMFAEEEIKRAAIVVIKAAAADVANHLGFPLDKLSYSDTPHLFMLEGKQISAAGTAWRETGTIKLYPHNLVGKSDTEMVMAHEVGHIRYEAVTRARLAESQSQAWKDEPRNTVPHTDAAGNVRMMDFIRADGTIREGAGHEKKYPVTAATEQFQVYPMQDKLAKEDGVTEYSRAWWRAFEKTEATRHIAMHETFAEISALDYANKKKDKPETLAKLGVKPSWRKLYTAYTKSFKAITKAQKAVKP